MNNLTFKLYRYKWMLILFIMLTGCDKSTKTSNSNQAPIDTTAPIVTLNGENPVTILEGDTYIEFGASAIDDRDGEVDVSITGEVNSLIPATYTVTYTATDIAGNSNSVHREVIVNPTNAFITYWKTDNSGVSADNQIYIGTYGNGYNYTIDWGDGQVEYNVTGDITHTYSSHGEYTVSIKGDFPQLYFGPVLADTNNSGNQTFTHDNHKLISVEQWGDIQWKSMFSFFKDCKDLQIVATDIPDLTDVRSMRHMFHGCSFIGYIDQWDVSNVTDMGGVFFDSSFNGDISQWNVSNVIDMSDMFYKSPFNGDVSQWDVSNVTNMSHMFSNSHFTGDVSQWDVSNVTNMSHMFSNSHFTGDVSQWDVSNVTDMNHMFMNSQFNGDVSMWDVRNVTNMTDMFRGSAFNGDITLWSIEKLTDMSYMFYGSFFNGDISQWDVSNVTNMSHMFSYSHFTGDVSQWDVSNVTNMSHMFSNSHFTGDVSQWDVSNVTDMNHMFMNSQFNGDVSMWDITNVDNMEDIFLDAKLSTENYDFLLRNWSQLSVKNNVKFSVGNTKYSLESQAFKDIFINIYGWVINDGGAIDTKPPFITLNGDREINLTRGQSYTELGASAIDNKDGEIQVTITGSVDTIIAGTYFIQYSATDNSGNSSSVQREVIVHPSRAFITRWVTNNEGISDFNQVMIGTNGDGYDYTINWGDGKVDHNVTGDITHTYDIEGVYTISILGIFPQLYFHERDTILTPDDFKEIFTHDNEKLISVEQWGDIKWQSMHSFFRDTPHLKSNASDIPNLTDVEDMSYAFEGSSFDGDVSQWDVSNVKSLLGTFANTPTEWKISQWDVSNVTDMRVAFVNVASKLDISQWDVSNVTDMTAMFRQNLSNPDISNWNVENVTNMERMFYDSNFSGDISKWNVSNVTNMTNMFRGSPFNGDISLWNIANVTNMDYMFLDGLFNKDISRWNVSNVTSMDDMFLGSALSKVNYDALLEQWSKLSLKSGVKLNAGSSTFSPESQIFKDTLTNAFGWEISDGGEATEVDITPPIITAKYDILSSVKEGSTYTEYGAIAIDDIDGVIDVTISGQVDTSIPGTYVITYTASDNSGNSHSIQREIVVYSVRPFVTRWRTDNQGVSNDNQIYISANFNAGRYDYTIDWGDGQINKGVLGDIVHTYDSPGEYTISIKGRFHQLYFLPIQHTSGSSVFTHDNHKLLSVEQWGSHKWINMESFFRDCQNLQLNALDNPYIVSLSMSNMFNGANFNGDISQWDTTNVTDMSSMFKNSNFVGDISQWNTSNVRNMNHMFEKSLFTGDISGWDVSGVVSMKRMFAETSLSTEHYDMLLKEWSQLNLKSDVEFDVGQSQYSPASQMFRDTLTDSFNWLITDGGVTPLENN